MDVRDLQEVPAVVANELVALLLLVFVEAKDVAVNADADVARNRVTRSFDLQINKTV